MVRLLRNGRSRRVSPIPVCRGEGRLTQSTAGRQLEKRELALVPHLRHSPTAARPSQIKNFPYERSAAARSHASETPGHAPEGVLAIVCLDNPSDNMRARS